MAQDRPSSDRAVKNGRIKQSIVYWCFEKYWDAGANGQDRPSISTAANSIGLIAPEFFPVLELRHGLSCAIGTVDMGPDHAFR